VSQSEGRKENQGSNFYAPSIKLKFKYYSKFCNEAELIKAATVISNLKNGSISDSWRSEAFNLCSLAVMARKGVDAVETLMRDPHLCVMCAYPQLLNGITFKADHYETTDLTNVTQYATTNSRRRTRIVRWSKYHDRMSMDVGDSDFVHQVWLWDHPHLFSYDLNWTNYTFRHFENINRLELECLLECDKLVLKWKSLDSTEFRCKTLYPFPGPPNRLVDAVRSDVWEQILACLFSLTTGMMQGGYELIETLWTEYGTWTIFDACLRENMLMVSDRLKVIDIAGTPAGIYIYYWTIHESEDPEVDKIISMALDGTL
jgi:hypothetical protein